MEEIGLLVITLHLDIGMRIIGAENQ